MTATTATSRRPSLTEFINDRLGVGTAVQARNFVARPLGAASPTEFWRYWNPVYGYVLRYFVYLPLRRALPRPVAVVATFASCGFFAHDLVGWLLARDLRFPFTTVAFVIFALIALITNGVGFNIGRAPFVIRATTNVSMLVFGLWSAGMIARWR